eukprot:TRINITY_DN10790_c0_g1_i1.p1 TRINITY_DN10790_c0_g1~~TRINITY_DN10790_c0_g1_i1.p1  ORF type:complete len:489 (+),score=63.35 TRINITY_DN10790_c0_g1_i1:19-1485(+)
MDALSLIRTLAQEHASHWRGGVLFYLRVLPPASVAALVHTITNSATSLTLTCGAAPQHTTTAAATEATAPLPIVCEGDLSTSTIAWHDSVAGLNTTLSPLQARCLLQIVSCFGESASPSGREAVIYPVPVLQLIARFVRQLFTLRQSHAASINEDDDNDAASAQRTSSRAQQRRNKAQHEASEQGVHSLIDEVRLVSEAALRSAIRSYCCTANSTTTTTEVDSEYRAECLRFVQTIVTDVCVRYLDDFMAPGTGKGKAPSTPLDPWHIDYLTSLLRVLFTAVPMVTPSTLNQQAPQNRGRKKKQGEEIVETTKEDYTVDTKSVHDIVAVVSGLAPLVLSAVSFTASPVVTTAVLCAARHRIQNQVVSPLLRVLLNGTPEPSRYATELWNQIVLLAKDSQDWKEALALLCDNLDVFLPDKQQTEAGLNIFQEPQFWILLDTGFRERTKDAHTRTRCLHITRTLVQSQQSNACAAEKNTETRQQETGRFG